MAYSKHDHISYILEAKCKRAISEKKKRKKTEIEWADFFSF